MPKKPFSLPLTSLFRSQEPKSAGKKAKKISQEELVDAVTEAEAKYRNAIEAHSVVRSASRELKKKIAKLRGDEAYEAKKLFDDVETERRSAAREENFRKRQFEDALCRAAIALHEIR